MNVHQKKGDFLKLNRPIQGLWDARGEKNLEALPDQNQKKLEEGILLQYIKKHMHVLDVGCGNGQAASQIAKVAKKVQGIDFSRAILEKARKRITWAIVGFIIVVAAFLISQFVQQIFPPQPNGVQNIRPPVGPP